MARKSKRMALYEAIQQGQAKIAEGLETGRLRSDAPAAQASETVNRPQVEVEMAPVHKKDSRRSSVKAKKTVSVSPKTIMAGVAVLLVATVFVMGFWLGAGRSEDEGADDKKSPVSGDQASNAESETKRPGRGIGFWAGGKQDDTDQNTTTNEQEDKTTGPVVVKTGPNVIVIASSNEAIKHELIPVQSFFKEKGIETEIIKGNSGYVFLVTKDGFKEAPSNKSSAGYQLLQRIKRYGLKYPEETGDTQWGRTKAFQDAYGYKRTD